MRKKMMKELNIAVVGATGNLGRELLTLLEEETLFKVKEISLVASGENSEEESSLTFKDKDHLITALKDADFSHTDVAFLAVPQAVAKEAEEKLKNTTAKVIDASAALKDAPLMVKGVTDLATKAQNTMARIANPLTTQLVTLLKPLQAKTEVKTIVSSTYQATSGAGRRGMDELFRQSTTMLGGAGAEAVPAEVHPVQIGFNAIPLVGDAVNEQTSEEIRVTEEVKNILGDDVVVNMTAVRIPTFVGYAQAVTLYTADKIEAETARQIFTGLAGVFVIDDIAKGEVSTPFGAAETAYTYVSRVRNNADGSLSFWVVSDNLRAGAACQMVDIAGLLLS